MVILQGNQIIGNVEIIGQTYCRICNTGCGYLNDDLAASCKKCGCSLLGTDHAEMQEILQYGVNACPTCLSLYCSGSELCKSCQIPLLLLFSVPQALSPNLTGLSPCPKCSNKTSHQTPFCDFCGRLLRIEYPYYYKHDPRPTIPIQLRNGKKTIKTVALIDFGATCTLFPAYLACGIGLDVTNVNTIQIAGVAPNATIPAFETVIEIGIEEKFYESPVLFSTNLPLNVTGILGHIGFLDRFDVKPDNVKRRVTIREHDVLREKQYQFCPACGTERKTKLSQFCYQCSSSLIS